MISDQMFKKAVLDSSFKLTQIILLLEGIKELNRPLMLAYDPKNVTEYKPGGILYIKKETKL